MCGFAGLLTSRGMSGSELADTARRMSDRLVHRGPDDQGAWSDEASGIGFGFRRLSILDLSDLGHQPMRSASGRFTIVYNGEIYNHIAMRRELERVGATFRGRSDTEVLVEGFEHWGIEGTVQRSIGMFAIAAWDHHSRCLHLIRDRLGIKPLVYFWTPGLLTFASELKALVAGPDFDRSLDLDGLAAYFRHLYVPAPRTIYRHARKLLPGHILTVREVDGNLSEPSCFWSLTEVARHACEHPLEGTTEEAIQTGDRLLVDAVVPRMQADVPLGAFLSGGIDSSLVVALMQAASSRPVRTFSIAFRERDYNEAAHAARVAEYLGTDHTELTLAAEDARAVVPRLAKIFDEPFASPSAIPNYLVSRLAREAVTVALSGTGGDEVFAGYNRYTFGERLLNSVGRVPGPARHALASAIRSVSVTRWDELYGLSRPLLPRALRQAHAGSKLHKVAALLDEPSRPDMYRSLLSSWQDPDALVIGGHEPDGRLESALACELDGAGWLGRIMLGDQLTYLSDDQLAKVDRVSMAVSLEVRVPLLDHRLVEFAWRLPNSLLRRRGEGKWLLRQILYRRVPRELVDRPKMGLSLPIDEWLRGPLRNWAEELLSPDRLESEGILRAGPIRVGWEALLAGRAPGLPIWTVIAFQAWKQEWLA